MSNFYPVLEQLLFLRLLLFPGLVYLGLGLFEISSLLRGVMTIAAAMPVFASSSVIMEKYGHKSDSASTMRNKMNIIKMR